MERNTWQDLCSSKDIMGKSWCFSIRIQTELGSFKLCVLGSLVFNPCVPAGNMGTREPSRKQGEAWELQRYELKFIFWGRILLWALGIDPQYCKYWLQQAGAWFAPWFLGAPKSEWEPNLALNLQERALDGFAHSWKRLFPSLWGHQGGEERNYTNNPKKNKTRTQKKSKAS